MKKILLALIITAASAQLFAQTKGTNTLGFGISSYTRTDQFGLQSSEQKQSSFSLTYGNFVKDYTKIGLGLTYSNVEVASTSSPAIKGDNYGGNVFYQKYFPLLKKLYAYAGGNLGYSYGKQSSSNGSQVFKNNSYSVGGYGGVSWFITKRFALEANLLSANAFYSKGTQENPTGNPSSSETKNFSLSTQGALNNGLGFNILFIF